MLQIRIDKDAAECFDTDLSVERPSSPLQSWETKALVVV